MGTEVVIEGLRELWKPGHWKDVTLTLPAGEISVMLGPSGTASPLS